MVNKIIFSTRDLAIKPFSEEDKDAFIELMTNPKVLLYTDPQLLDINKVAKRFTSNIDRSPIPSRLQDNIWGIFLNNESDLCGVVAVYTNSNDHWEIGYRFLPTYWGKGYGTQITKGIIEYCFNNLSIDYLRADVDLRNIASVKILSKFMQFIDEFYNESDKSMDKRFELSKLDWLK